MLQTPDQTYAMARFYLEEASWSIQEALEMYREDKKWGSDHPEFAQNSIIRKRILEELGKLDPDRKAQPKK